MKCLPKFPSLAPVIWTWFLSKLCTRSPPGLCICYPDAWTPSISSPHFSVQFHSVSHVQLFVTPWTAACQASLSTNSWSLFKLVSIKSVMPSNHLILCCPVLLPPSISTNIRVLSSESVHHIRWPKYWSFSFTEHLIFMIQILGQVSPAPDISQQSPH